MEINILYAVGHILGVAVGAGGAFMSDLMFFLSIKDRKISKTEISFIELGSKMVWFGLFILVVSGIGLFLGDPEKYINSSKFITKMFIVLVIFINGLFFHYIHLPTIHKQIDKYLYRSKEFMKNSKYLIVSGVVSIVSWVSAIALGSLRSIQYTYQEAICIYIFVLLVLSIITTSFHKKIFKK